MWTYKIHQGKDLQIFLMIKERKVNYNFHLLDLQHSGCNSHSLVLAMLVNVVTEGYDFSITKSTTVQPTGITTSLQYNSPDFTELLYLLVSCLAARGLHGPVPPL